MKAAVKEVQNDMDFKRQRKTILKQMLNECHNEFALKEDKKFQLNEKSADELQGTKSGEFITGAKMRT